MQVIAYVEDSGLVTILTPSPFCDLSIEQIAKKDVPILIVYKDDEDGSVISIPCKRDRPYLIIDDSELPDRELRDFWIIKDGKVVIDD